MSENTIIVPIKVERKEFYASTTYEALRNCQRKGFEAVFMPSIVDARIEAPGDARIWKNLYCAPSIRATRRTKQGTPVVVYAHIPNYFSNPDNIEKAIEQGLIKGAGIMPTDEFQKQDEFQRLLDLEDSKNVFVVDYNTLKNSPSGIIHVKDALKHPQTIPFLGGEERAEKYLQRHKEVFGDEIVILHSDDLSDELLGRILFVGSNYFNYGLYGNIDLDGCGRFVGLRAEGKPQKLEQQVEALYK